MCHLPVALRLLAPSALVVAAMGCGLLDEATAFTVETDWQPFIVDADALKLSAAGATLPSVPCSTAGAACEAAAGISCGGDSSAGACSVQCSAQKTCEIVAEVEVGSTIDLSQKIKDQTSASALSKVSFKEMLYKTTSNSLNFATPELEIFVGPRSATKTTDTGVVKFAILPSIPSGQTPSGLIDATEAGKTALAKLVKDFQNPFRWLVKATLRVTSGQAVPKGTLSLQLMARLRVEPLS